ncbi:sentrin-specific protease 2 isoform X2 [Saccopteryx bilineata]|uniref:sentrin-specific protease 2 isoform X2 n=1 Tax=Saccopteryx bilineata TaxID=59482 RepID=UPI00338D508E
MYKWLVRILGTIFRFCDRPEPPARALLKRRRSNRLHYSPSENQSVQCCQLVRIPTSADHKAHGNFCVQRNTECRPFRRGSGSWNNMLKLGNKSPNGISDYPKIRVTVTRDQPRRVLPSLGFTLNLQGYSRRPSGRRHSRGNPESSFTWKPQEQITVEMVTEESGRGLRRPHCTVEEGVQKEEREKYQRLLERLKEGVSSVTSTHHSSQKYHMDTLKTKGLVEEQSHGVRTTQFVPKQYRIVETRGPLCPVRSEKRCSKGKFLDTEKTVGIRLETEGRRGHQLEPDLSEEVSARLRLGSGSNGLFRRKMSILETKEKNCLGKERDKRTDDLLELTEDMEKEISNALGHGPQDEILSSAFKLRITRGDIQTLRNYHWLNDEIINFYMNLLVERNKKQGYPVLHAFSTFFYPKLKSGGYQAVKRWTKGVNLFEQELILVPIHRKVHWSLVVIDLRKKCLKYLDSMGQKGHRICEILLQYLQDESKTKRNTDLNLLEWTHYSMKPHEIPQQLNGSDCGMFTCKYADYMSRDKPITFTQHQMPLFRKKMVWEILHQQLL